MRTPIALRPIALLLVLLVSACGSPPTHFFTLTPVPPAAGAADAAVACPRGLNGGSGPLTVNRVLLPETLDRESIVRFAGADRIDISDQDRWAAPLDGMVQTVLAQDLRARLPPGRVLLPGDASPPNGTTRLDVNIAHFAADSAGHVTLQADWTLLDRHGTVALERVETIGANATSPRTGSVVTAMNQVLGDFADHIAHQIRACSAGR